MVSLAEFAEGYFDGLWENPRKPCRHLDRDYDWGYIAGAERRYEKEDEQCANT